MKMIIIYHILTMQIGMEEFWIKKFDNMKDCEHHQASLIDRNKYRCEAHYMYQPHHKGEDKKIKKEKK